MIFSSNFLEMAVINHNFTHVCKVPKHFETNFPQIKDQNILWHLVVDWTVVFWISF